MSRDADFHDAVLRARTKFIRLLPVLGIHSAELAGELHLFYQALISLIRDNAKDTLSFPRATTDGDNLLFAALRPIIRDDSSCNFAEFSLLTWLLTSPPPFFQKRDEPVIVEVDGSQISDRRILILLTGLQEVHEKVCREQEAARVVRRCGTG